MKRQSSFIVPKLELPVPKPPVGKPSARSGRIVKVSARISALKQDPAAMEEFSKVMSLSFPLVTISYHYFRGVIKFLRASIR